MGDPSGKHSQGFETLGVEQPVPQGFALRDVGENVDPQIPGTMGIDNHMPVGAVFAGKYRIPR